MRVSRALAVAAVVLSPAALVTISAASASAAPAVWCGAITMNPDCHPGEAPPAPPVFPYSGSFAAASIPQQVVQPADSPATLSGMQPVATNQTIGSPAPADKMSLSSAPVAAASAALGAFAALSWARRKQQGN
jgi:hypothetical protein